MDMQSPKNPKLKAEVPLDPCVPSILLDDPAIFDVLENQNDDFPHAVTALLLKQLEVFAASIISRVQQSMERCVPTEQCLHGLRGRAIRGDLAPADTIYDIFGGCRVLQVPQSGTDAAHFLAAIFNSKCALYLSPAPNTTPQLFSSFDALFTRVSFDAIAAVFRLSLTYLSSVYPTTPAEFASAGFDPSCCRDQILSVIHFARSHSLHWILPFAFYRYCLEITWRTQVHGVEYGGAKVVLSYADQELCYNAERTKWETHTGPCRNGTLSGAGSALAGRVPEVPYGPWTRVSCWYWVSEACPTLLPEPQLESRLLDAQSDDSLDFCQTPPFNDPAADVILSSSDGVDFRVYRLVLSLLSSVFKDMFSVPQPQDDPAVPSITMAESAVVLDGVLRFCYPGADTVGITPTAKQYVQGYMDAQPIAVFAIACRHEWRELATDAARRSLELPIRAFDEQTPELTGVDAAHYHTLLKYHAACGAASKKTVEVLRWLEAPPDEGIWWKCTPRTLWPARDWFITYLTAVKDVVAGRPLARLDDPEFMVKAVKGLSKCTQCRYSGFAQLRPFVVNTLGPRIRSVIDEVSLDLGF
ncbi:hypothetical protein B0H19DRAFT_1239718 [Mycena capillaripes]|nr:hypothetical protein B0H19DRAFT_1239718 [Mycena capillaripes]